jgi:hypothetical protein
MKGEVPLSRLSDIWSLGCVMFEYIVWLLYGGDEADRFGDELLGKAYNIDTKRESTAFYLRKAAGQAVLNPTVNRWLAHMMKDPEGSKDTAIGALLSILQDYMLTTGTLRSNWEKFDHIHTGPVLLKPGTRASARESLRLLDGIIAEARKKSGAYCFKVIGMTKGQQKRKATGPASSTSGLLPIHTLTPPQKEHFIPVAAVFRHARSTGAKKFPLTPLQKETVHNPHQKRTSRE